MVLGDAAGPLVHIKDLRMDFGGTGEAAVVRRKELAAK